jgi:hypothetical protein
LVKRVLLDSHNTLTLKIEDKDVATAIDDVLRHFSWTSFFIAVSTDSLGFTVFDHFEDENHGVDT